MQWIGAFLLIISTTSIGLYLATKFEQRPKHLRQLIQSLQILEAEITYSQATLQDAFLKISSQLPKPLNDFYKQIAIKMQGSEGHFITIWCDTADRLMEKTSYKKTEIEVLKQFGRSLGQHDFLQQQKQIKLALTHLEHELEEAYDEQKKYAKLVKSLGVLSGLFIVLILI